MHIPDGMVPGEVCTGGWAAAALLTWASLKRGGRGFRDPAAMISRASVMAAAFFVVSWIHIPLPPVSVHPVLAGLMGIVLGWFAVPAVLIGLFFQAVMFGHGGITTLGLNTVAMGGAALTSWFLFRAVRRKGSGGRVPLAGFIAGFAGVLLAAAITAAILVLTIPSFMDPAAERAGIVTMLLSHVPLAAAEGALTAAAAGFLQRTHPGMLA